MSGVIVGMRDAVVRVRAFIAMASSCNVAARRPIDRLQRSSDIIVCTCQLPLTLLRIVNLHNSPVRALNWVGGVPPAGSQIRGTSYSRSTTSSNGSCTSKLRSGNFLPGSTTLLRRIQASASSAKPEVREVARQRWRWSLRVLRR